MGRYACLSHCWGSNPLLRTTTANFEEHKAGISFNLLPKTFRDAIIVARKLDIQYIWIDSLCIIQDSKDDWERESANMAAIYQNCCITIAASNSRSSMDGCFVVAPEYVSRSVTVSDADEIEHVIRVRQILKHGGWPLLKRGWFFQERLLSPRVLHFGHAELVWECLDRRICECSRCTKPGCQETDFILAEKHRVRQALLSSPSADRSLPDHWRELVEIYSSMALTYEKDIFPALSGAASHMQQYRKSRYTAGLWEDTLLEDLLWQAFDGKTAFRSAEWRSPTWSWASIIGRAQYCLAPNPSSLTPGSFGVKRSYIQIIEACCEHSGLDPNGELKSAHLRLVGRLTPASIEYDTFTYENGLNVLNSYTLYILGSEGIASLNGFEIDYNVSRPGRWYVESGAQLYLLKMASTSHGTGSGGILYLVLRCTDEEGQVYERIGFYEDVAELSPDGKYEEFAKELTITII
jgi:hypothetical protein